MKESAACSSSPNPRSDFEARLRNILDTSSKETAVIALSFTGLQCLADHRRVRIENLVRTLLRQKLRDTDLVEFLGDDNYAVCLPLTGHEGASTVVRRLSEELEAYAPRPGLLAVSPADGEYAEELLRTAIQEAQDCRRSSAPPSGRTGGLDIWNWTR